MRVALLALVMGTAGCATANLDRSDPDGGGNPTTDADTVGLDGALPSQCETSETGWRPVGASIDAVSAPGTDATWPSITSNSAGELIVAFAEGDGSSDIHVYRYQGASWQPMADSLSAVTGSSSAMQPIVRAHQGEVVVAFPEVGGATGTGFFAYRWSGSAWAAMGGGDLSTTSANVAGGDVFFETDGTALVAWTQYQEGQIGRSRVQVRRFAGASYVPVGPEVGGIAGPGASALTPKVLRDGAGKLRLIFAESGVRAVERNATDTDWVQFGPDEVHAFAESTSGWSPQVAQDVDGQILLQMAENDGTAANAYLLKWNGSDWIGMGGAQNAYPEAQTHVQTRGVVVDITGQPVVAWTEYKTDGDTALFVRRVQNGVLTDLGEQPLSAFPGVGSISTASITTDHCGRVVAAFAEQGPTGDHQVFVYRYMGP